MSLKVPDTLTEYEVLTALYNHARVDKQGKVDKYTGAPLCNKEDAQNLFMTACPEGSCSLVRGKKMPVEFGRYRIEIKEYDAQYGKEAAARALKAFEDRKSEFGSGYDKTNCQPCKRDAYKWDGEQITRYS